MKNHEMPSNSGESPKPNLESQRHHLSEIQARHSEQLSSEHLSPEGNIEPSMSSKAIESHLKYLNESDANASPPRGDERQKANREEEMRALLSDPSQFTVNRQTTEQGDVFYGITVGDRWNIPVGRETWSGMNEDGEPVRSIAPMEGFSEADGLTIRDMIRELDAEKENGSLPDLDVDSGRLPLQETVETPAEAAEAELTEADHFALWEQELAMSDTPEGTVGNAKERTLSAIENNIIISRQAAKAQQAKAIAEAAKRMANIHAGPAIKRPGVSETAPAPEPVTPEQTQVSADFDRSDNAQVNARAGELRRQRAAERQAATPEKSVDAILARVGEISSRNALAVAQAESLRSLQALRPEVAASTTPDTDIDTESQRATIFSKLVSWAQRAADRRRSRAQRRLEKRNAKSQSKIDKIQAKMDKRTQKAEGIAQKQEEITARRAEISE